MNRGHSIVLIVAAALIGGCSDEDQKQACPASGLGVTSPSGKKCSSILENVKCSTTDSGYCVDPELEECRKQIEEYKSYDCKEPQVCFDTSFQPAWGFVISPSASAYSMSFILTNCSTGNQKLVISKVEVLGNSRCSFDFDMNCGGDAAAGGCDVEKLEIAPGDSGLIRARYFPTTPGEDDAILRVHSNAQNFPQLDLYMCGSGIPRYQSGADSGPPPDFGVVGGFDGGVGRFCKNVTTPENCP